MEMPETETTAIKRPVWNAGRSVGAKRALKPKQIWEIRFFLNERRPSRGAEGIDPALRGNPCAGEDDDAFDLCHEAFQSMGHRGTQWHSCNSW